MNYPPRQGSGHRLRNGIDPAEPFFDLIAKVIGANAKQKQLPVQRLDNVRTYLILATLSVQIAMIANSIWELPHRNISDLVEQIGRNPSVKAIFR